ncbi:MAG: phosphoserine phosphatase SerB [Idiomarina sp.]|jgi:phosphoserine phosphatase|uniref:phosphoserine phosphatase SerB n=1 Tax=Idiomarina sp. TaxID=1874361 RepID=UPI000AEC02F1|nr:phosphoserine phosphatase SerB [Idiomarina sp.]MCH2455741.1 phosphoserine phosphatase SerB [Idiomarina sp.]NQZ15132.1 phosphoserine phosphatase SerB [Idiomarina sp.]
MKYPSGLIVFDMDSTLIGIECIDEIARLNDCYTKVAEITKAAMEGKIDFSESLRQRVACLQGVSESSLQRLFNPIPLHPGAQELFAELKEKGWRRAIVSGGFTWFADRLAAELQADAVVANQLEVKDGQLTGRVVGDIVDAKIKAQSLQDLANQWGIPMSKTVAVGDGANDAMMLENAAVGIAYCAKPSLKRIADYCIEEPDLRQVLTCLSHSKLL